jgi:regulatory protein
LNSNSSNLLDNKKKLETYCAYQERCHKEVVSKLWSLGTDQNEIDEVICHLIAENFLNEERFSCAFARGKHRIKNWGKVRIVNELKFRNITARNITTALKEISADEYYEAFQKLSERIWDSIHEKNSLKKRKKFCDYLLRKGWESDLVYSKVKELETNL